MQNLNKNLDYSSLGERIARLRNGLSQKKFADKFGVSQSDVSRLEKGTYKKPDIELLYRICIEYKKNIDWLLTGKDVEKEDEKELTDEESEYLEKLLYVLRNPNTREAIEKNVDTFLKVPPIEGAPLPEEAKIWIYLDKLKAILDSSNTATKRIIIHNIEEAYKEVAPPQTFSNGKKGGMAG